jgi:hypothetical protein
MNTKATLNFIIVINILFLNCLNAQNYDKKFFPIGVFSVRGNFRPVDDFLFNVDKAASLHHTSFKNLKKQGFNSAFLSYDPIGPTLDTILDIAELNQIKVIPPMINLHSFIRKNENQNVTDDDIRKSIIKDSIDLILKSSQILGYYIYDEPLPGWIDFDLLKRAKNILKDMTVDVQLPILSTWNSEQHMKYIDSFLDLDILMMDSYPFEDGDAIGDISDYMPSYFTSMPDPPSYSDYINSVRKNHCEEKKRPLWVVLQAFGDLEEPENGGYWRQVYPKEIRLEVYLALMQGAKGIWYFLYESEFPYLLGMLDVSGQPTQRLIEVIKINKEIEALSTTLLNLEVATDQSGVSIDSGEVKLHYDTTSTNRNQYIICVNTNIFSKSHPTITIDHTAVDVNKLTSIIDVLTDENIPFSITDGNLFFSPTIEAGNGRLLKINTSPLSAKDFKSKFYLFVEPNPVSDFLNIISNQKVDYFQLYDVTGRVLNEGKLIKKRINIQGFSSGIYFIKFKTNNGIITKKVIKI